MTEITSDNFDEMLPHIVDAIRSCSFVGELARHENRLVCFPITLPILNLTCDIYLFSAVDTELTGLHYPGQKPSLFDTAEDRYGKKRISASAFRITQFGLTTFTRTPLVNK